MPRMHGVTGRRLGFYVGAMASRLVLPRRICKTRLDLMLGIGAAKERCNCPKAAR